MEKNYLNEFTMRQASIYELRNIAREVGVISPTTLKKEELIAKVLKIINGEEKPEMPKSKQGRPPKSSVKNLESLSFNDSNVFNTNSTIQQDFYNFSSSLPSEIGILSSRKGYEDEMFYQESDCKSEIRSGYYYFMGEYGFIFESGKVSNIESAISVSNKIAKEHNLKSGDHVKCRCREVLSNNTKFLTEVLEINGKNCKESCVNQNFDNIKIINKQQKLFEENSLIVNFGSRNIFFANDRREFLNIYSKISDRLKSISNVKILRLNFKVLPEELNLFCNKEESGIFENFYSILTDTAKQNVFTIKLFIERIKRLAELNYNVIVFVEDILNCVKFNNLVEGYEIKDIKNKSLELIFNLLTVSRIFNENSITLFVSLKNNVKDEFYNSIFEELQNINCNFIDLN